MIKITHVLVMIMLSGSLFSQSSSLGLYVGVFNEDTKESSKLGLGFSGSLYNLYFDYVSNYAFGKGEELYYATSQTCDSQKVQVSLINLGYRINVKWAYFIPTIGFGWRKHIYQDPVGWDTYYYGDTKIKFNPGLIAGIKLQSATSIFIGTGLFEIFKGGISIHF